ncbi:MAG: hypothetical protein ACOYM3_17745 [Terrimicrobiaceae bacterium]
MTIFRSFPTGTIPATITRALLLAGFPLCLQASGDISLQPEGRQKVELRPSERNPFTQQVSVEAPVAETKEGTTEESRLRSILRAIKISGISGKPGHKQVLLGSLIIKPGDTLPKLLSNQFEDLRVVSVDDASIILAFVERDSSADARQIILPIAIKPEVTQFMYGEAFEKLVKVGANGQIDAPPLSNQGADDFLKGSQEADLKNMADRDVQLMGVIHDAEPAEKKE